MDLVTIDILAATNSNAIILFNGRVYIIPATDIIFEDGKYITSIFGLNRTTIIANNIWAQGLMLLKEVNIYTDEAVQHGLLEDLDNVLRRSDWV